VEEDQPLAKEKIVMLWLMAPAVVILLVGCYGGSSSTPGRETSATVTEVDGSGPENRTSANERRADSEEGSGRSRTVKFTVPTVT